MNIRVAEAAFLDESMVADERRLPANDGLGAPARNRLELCRGPGTAIPDSTARARIARPTGCSDRASRPAAISRISSMAVPFSGITSTTCGTPFVSVPGLVERDAANGADALEMHTALDQHALARGGGNGRHD